MSALKLSSHEALTLLTWSQQQFHNCRVLYVYWRFVFDKHLSITVCVASKPWDRFLTTVTALNRNLPSSKWVLHSCFCSSTHFFIYLPQSHILLLCTKVKTNLWNYMHRHKQTPKVVCTLTVGLVLLLSCLLAHCKMGKLQNKKNCCFTNLFCYSMTQKKLKCQVHYYLLSL